jgi:hypothetical protein
MSIRTKIEWAFGANLTADPATWTWTDVSLFALDAVSLQFGSADEGQQSQPTAAKFRLRNTDGRFSPRFPTSPYYPNVRKQTPVRISQDPGTGTYTQRFQGYADEITPVWPAGNSDVAEVEVTASGILRRLGQGTPALRSAMYRAYVRSAPTAYWSLEDGPSAVRADSPIAGVGPMIVRPGSVVNWATGAGPDGSAPVAGFARSGVPGVLVGVVPPAPSATSWRVEVSAKFGALSPGGFNEALRWDTAGTIAQWEIVASEQSSGGLYVQYITATGVPGGPFVSNIKVDDQLWHHIRVDAAQSGGNIALTVTLDGALAISQTIVGATIGMITPVYTNPTGVADESSPELGHIAAWAPWSGSVDTYTAFLGHVGETARDRIIRLCTEEVIPYTVSASLETSRMGPQSVTTVVALLRECEAVDGGILYDGFGPGITYIAALDRSSLAATMALDCNRQQVKLPFSPTEDDQRVRNRWTVSRLNGGSGGATFTDDAHVTANNGVVYADSTSINALADTQLLDAAGWRTNLGTVEEMRVPGITLQLIDHPELWAPWLAMRPGYRMTAASLPVQYPPGTLDMALEGATEAWNAVSWRVEANTAPYAPWRVAQFAADTGDVSEFCGRFDPDDAALNAGITATATSIAVKTNSGPLWTTAADDFPLDIAVGGERMRVTAISGASSPQTFTVTRSVNGVVKAHLVNAPVTLWAPLVFAK